MNKVRKIWETLLNPFTQHSVFLMILWMLVSAGHCLTITLFHSNFYFSLCWAILGLLMCYLITLPLPNKGWTSYKGILLILGGINFLADFSCGYIMRLFYFEDYAGILLNTNFSESTEFIQTFFPWKLLIRIFFVLLFICGIGFLLGKIFIRKKWTAHIGLAIVFFGFFFVIAGNKWDYYKNIFLGKLYTLSSIALQLPPDLKEFYSSPCITVDKSNSPRNLIVVIGESFAKSHSSLYGYEKRTNPRLEELRDSSKLYVFSNVTSAAHSTIPNFQCIMSTYRMSMGNSIKWYECTTLAEILELSEIRTCWISNQGRKGLFDNVPTRYAELSDTSIFVGNQFDSSIPTGYDQNVISPLAEELKNQSAFQVTIVHLMGSHAHFEHRYPPQQLYTATDYESYPSSQRSILAHYDNSILYNDSVVFALINIAKKHESVLIYFPDHGLDVYQTQDDYIGHAIVGSSDSFKYAVQIPFVIYVSPSYEKRNPDFINRIKENLHSPFVTENIIYTIMDIMGIKFAQNEDVLQHSLLNIHSLKNNKKNESGFVER